nr:DNA mismatch repair protein MutS [Candidatus Paracaedibacter symbiosus]
MQAALNLGFQENSEEKSIETIELPQPQKSPIPGNLSPVMAQYCQLKEEYSDSLLFFRLGDFYELFFDDAVIAARDMDIVLTKRGKTEGDDIPMCGVPAHTYETYLARLIQKGHKVAICEQVEDPETAKKRGAKGPLKREVVRVVTPGTLTEETLLNSRQNNFLLAISPLTKSDIGVAVIDLSTGTFFIESTDLKHLPGVLSRLNPVEIVIPDKLLQEPSLFEHLNQWKKKLSPLPQARFDIENCKRRLEEVYVVKTLDAFGYFSDAEVRAAGALIDYIQITQKSALKLIDRPRQLKNSQLMVIDPATRKSLELHTTQSGQKVGSLLDTIDYTLTAAGSRTLSFYLSAPLTNAEQINHRLTCVDFLIQHQNIRNYLREVLKLCPDVERALSRLNLGRGNPRDLGAIRDGLAQAQQLKQSLSQVEVPLLLEKTLEKLGSFGDTIDKLARALGESLPFQARDGNFIASDYNSELDSFRYFRDHSKEHLAKLQEEYIARTGVNTLKIKHNNVIGYHIDVGVSHAQKIPDDFIHRQTMASSLRYTTPELAEVEKKIVSAAQQILDLELKIFEDLVQDIKLQVSGILGCCRALAVIDVLSALAELAIDQNYCRPIVDESLTFDVQQGFHPVVASVLKKNHPSLLSAMTVALLMTKKSSFSPDLIWQGRALICAKMP